MFRVRFRFWLQKKLDLKETERRMMIAGREILLSAQMPDVSIADSEWLVMNARGIESEAGALDFARKLKASSELSSAVSRLGINAGVDQPTVGFGQIVRDDAKEKHGIVLRDNVHGIDIFPDDPNIRIGHFSMTATVRSRAQPFLSDIDEFFKVIDSAPSRAKDIILLMNYALTRSDPVAMIVFAISAVEMLGQDETWSASQTHLLKDLADAAEKSSLGGLHERQEVAEAIRRSIHKLSLRQGVIRLLASLDLIHLKRKWDDVYAERSSLIHGLAPKPGIDYGDLASRTMNLCGHILLTAIATEVVGADKHINEFYPVK